MPTSHPTSLPPFPAPDSARLAWLQALRAVAALMVLLFHAHPYLVADIPPLEPYIALSRWGFSGVEVFFALSGFVVFRSATRAHASGRLGSFVRHRFLRIYLGYWPALLVLALASVFVAALNLPDLPNLFRSVFLVQSTLEKHWLVPAWSLQYELYFYALAAALLLVAPSRPGLAVGGALLVLVGWNAGFIWFAPNVVYSGQQPLKHLLSGSAIVFFAGALVSVAVDAMERKGLTLNPAVAVAAAAVALLAGTMGVSAQAAFNLTLRAATFGVMAVALLVLFLAMETTRLRPWKWLVAIGDASFGLYVLHTALLSVFQTFWGGARDILEAPRWFLTLAAAAMPFVIVAVSLWWFRRVEHPLYQAGLRRFGGGTRAEGVKTRPAHVADVVAPKS